MIGEDGVGRGDLRKVIDFADPGLVLAAPIDRAFDMHTPVSVILKADPRFPGHGQLWGILVAFLFSVAAVSMGVKSWLEKRDAYLLLAQHQLEEVMQEEIGFGNGTAVFLDSGSMVVEKAFRVLEQYPGVPIRIE